ncbi:MAG: PaaI family thioesterase [Myxococcales bacterium]|nr:PaaI family thioesterase [Myxococcales bacterium]
MDGVRRWVEQSPYAVALGVELEALSDTAARVLLPYRDENSNPGKVLHGGCAASLAVIGAHAVARTALGADSAPWHTASLQVNYLAAAKDEAVTAEARLLRQGKAMCFVEVDVATANGKPIAHATAMVRGRFGAEPAALAACAGDAGESAPGPMGPLIERVPFIGNRGIGVEHMTGGHSRLVMPLRGGNGDEGGGVHEGAVLALIDTTGAMAAWAETGPGPYRASTPSIQAQILAPPPKDDLVGYGRTVQRDRELLWADVAVADGSDARLWARGTVVYRILT